MKQQCTLVSVWLTWLALPLLAIFFGLRVGWSAGIFVVVVGILAELMYLRYFPYVSRWIGYGSVDDEPAIIAPKASQPAKVTLYTAMGCPFCPLVRRRLRELQQTHGFELEEIDVIFRPDLVRAQGFTSVPVIEIGDRHWIGHATTAQLAEFLAGS